ncbi:WSC domain protein [Stagonosporopsis vannaccii]|nr:WSC domain protein [Stagonosporopsis vannaccii]
MRCTVLPLAALVSGSFAQSFFYDQRTTTDCIAWDDIGNATERTCEEVLRYWSLEPVRFHNWNPSVGLDCAPWFSNTSYCVLTNATVWDTVNSSTLTSTVNGYQTVELTLAALTTDKDGWTIPVTRPDAPVRTTSTRAPIPSPATWKHTGCFVDTFNDDWDLPVSEWEWILDYRFVPNTADETPDSCKQKCWEIAYPVAGVKGGNECFCGDRNNGTRAQDQSECNTPCGGDAQVMCGGTNRTSVWEAEGYVQSTAAAAAATAATATGAGAGAGAGAGSASRTDASGATATASSGARRNAAMFWRI